MQKTGTASAKLRLSSLVDQHKKPRGGRLAERTAGNAVWNIVPLVWSTVLNVVALPMIIRKLGFADYGLYGVFALFLAPLTLANLGFGEATIKYVAQYAAKGDLLHAARYIRTTFFMNLSVGLGGALLLCTAGPPLAVRLATIEPGRSHLLHLCFYAVAAGWVGNQVAAVFMGVPSAFQNYRAVALTQIVTGTTTTGLALGVVLGNGGILGYTIATATGSLVSALSWFIVSSRMFGTVSLAPKLFRDAWKSSFRFGGWQALAQVGGMAANQIERVIITGLFRGTKPLGYFNNARAIQERLYFVVFKMSEVLFPLFSQISEETLAQKADKLMRASWLLTSLAVAVLAPLIPLAKPLLIIYINAEAGEHVATLLRVMATGGILGCATTASYYYLLGHGRTEWTAIISMATGLTTVLASLALLPAFGFKAAAFPSVVAMLVQQYFLGFRMLPSVFGGQISRWRILLSLYSPLAAALPVACLLWAAKPERFIRGYLTLVPSYFIVSGLCFAMILATNRFLKGGLQQEQDVLRLWKWLRGVVWARMKRS